MSSCKIVTLFPCKIVGKMGSRIRCLSIVIRDRAFQFASFVPLFFSRCVLVSFSGPVAFYQIVLGSVDVAGKIKSFVLPPVFLSAWMRQYGNVRGHTLLTLKQVDPRADTCARTDTNSIARGVHHVP